MKINFKKLSKKQLIIVIVIAVFVIALITLGTISIVKQESPVDLISGAFSSEEELIGSWQGENAVNAYVFYEDGTYDSYLSTFSIKGQYDVDGNEITLSSLGASGSVVYRYKVKGDTLTLTLVRSNGAKVENKEEHTFTKVDHLNMKTLTEVIQDLAEQIQDDDETSEETTEKTTEDTVSQEDNASEDETQE